MPDGAQLDVDDDSDDSGSESETDDELELGPRTHMAIGFRQAFRKPPRKSHKRKLSTQTGDVNQGHQLQKGSHQLQKESPLQEAKAYPRIQGHRTVREQLQFLVMHDSNQNQPVPETEFVYDRHELIDEYLGDLTDIVGYDYTDRGWIYKMRFQERGTASFNIPVRHGEEYQSFDTLWARHAGDNHPLLTQQSPPAMQRKFKKNRKK